MVAIACVALLGVCGVLSAPRLATNVELLSALVCAGLFVRCRIGPPLVALALSAAVATLDARARLDDWLAPELERSTLTVSGVVVSVPQRRSDGVRFVFAPQAEADPRLPRRIELSWYDAEALPRATERWTLDVRLRRPRGFANPGGTDLAAHLLRERIGATGYVRNGHRLADRFVDSWRHPALRLRGRVADSLHASLGERPATGVITGLAVGLQDALSVEQWRELSRTGASHLMAISGLHISMVGSLFAWFAARVQRQRQLRGSLLATRDVAVCAGCTAATLYAVLAGASVPTQRTLVMIAVAAVALQRRRNVGVVEGLAFALLIVLGLDPLAPLASGFWLSFGAVLAIVAGLAGYVTPPRLLAGYLRTQFVVTVGLVPVVAGAFGNVSLVSVPVNLLAIPLYTLVIVPLALLGSLAAMLGPTCGRAALVPTAWLIEATWPLFSLPAAGRWATWTIPALDPCAWLLLGIGVAAALAPFAIATRVAALVLIASVCVWRPERPPAGQADVTVLDVGQGLAVVVETRNHLLVYDAGPAFRSGSDAGQLVVLPFLAAGGWREIDTLVVSHDDADHAGGAKSIRDALRVRRFVTGNRDPADPTSRSCRNEVWTWDGVEFEWLTPVLPARLGDNDRSCVLLVSAAGQRLLLPGDIEAAAERELLARGLSAVDVVVVPHHGSRSSSSERFVARTSPRWAIVSAGYLNRWNFPRTEIVERWRAAGASLLTTADRGAIQLRLGSEPPAALSTWRRQYRRFWHGDAVQ